MKRVLHYIFIKICPFLFILGTLVIPLPLLAKIDNGPEVSVDTVKPKSNFVEKFTEITDLYGSLRFKAGGDFYGNFGITDQTSSLGIKGRVPIIKGIDAIAQLEVGVNVVGNMTKIHFNGDPGGAVGEINNAFTSRLGWVGIETKYGSLTWGKQWSPYYDIGVMTDMFYGFGGNASGTYAANTDGAVAGTGRSSNAFQYRLKTTWVNVALQVQNRTLTDSSGGYADTYGGSVLFKSPVGLKAGVSYIKVRDGIVYPNLYEPKVGDESFIAGIMYDKDHWYIAVTYCNFTNHERDDLGNYFTGFGIEFIAQDRFLKRWSVYGGLNYLQPKNESVAGEYRLSYLDVGSNFTFGKTSCIFIEMVLSNSMQHDGTPYRRSGIAFGMYFNFGY